MEETGFQVICRKCAQDAHYGSKSVGKVLGTPIEINSVSDEGLVEIKCKCCGQTIYFGREGF